MLYPLPVEDRRMVVYVRHPHFQNPAGKRASGENSRRTFYIKIVNGGTHLDVC